MDLQLTGKRALVTGGSRGLGRAIARQLALEGVDCAICARSEAPLTETARALTSETGRRIIPFVADTSDAGSITALVRDAAAALGGIEILVNNAARVGGSAPEDFASVTDELILRDFGEKFLGYFRCARAVAPMMRATGWGRIINLSGLAARTAGSVTAGARNAAVIHLTKTLAQELGHDGITVNAIYPALTLTETLTERVSAQAKRENQSPEDLLKQMGSRSHIGRLVTAEEVACVATFLASPRAAGITGEVLPVTGGQGSSVYY